MKMPILGIRHSEFHHIDQMESIPADRKIDFQSNRVARLRAWWCRASGAGAQMPRKLDFDIIHHFDLAPNLFLAERGDDGRFRYRIRGETILWMFGGLQRGRSVAAYASEEFQQNIEDYYNDVLAKGFPVLLRGDLRFVNGLGAAFESLDCPLAGPDGTPRYILGLADLVPGEQRLAS